MPPEQDDAWGRVGALLVQRRIEISPRYRNRRLFAAERGVNWRLLHDIERAKRANFEPETLAAIEAAYDLAPGAIARALAGGGLEPREAAPRPPAASLPPRREPPAGDDDRDLRPFLQSVLRDLYAAAGIMPRLRPGQLLPPLEETPEIADLLQQVPGGQAFSAQHEAATWDSPLLSPPKKAAAIARWRRLAAEYEAHERGAI